MQKKVTLTGNDSVAEALRQINPDVCAAYPITPQTEMMHKFAEFVGDGEVDTNFITVESEHSAMSACIGSCAAGVRTITATCGPGLALMWEMLYVAAGLRLPIVMACVNRALSAPLNIHGDHSDSFGARDAGWIQLFSENAQEAYDNAIQAFRIAEHPSVLTPAMVCLDGFISSHTMEVLNTLPDADVKKFVGEYKPSYSLLNIKKPITIGPLVLPDYYFECRRQQVEGMRNAKKVLLDVAKDFEKLSGRKYGFFETYKLEDAEIAFVGLSSSMGTIRTTVDELRASGKKAGLLKLRCYRPFPADEIAQALSHLKVVAIMDRCISYGLDGGPLYQEVRSAMYGMKPAVVSYIYGLGGRDLRTDDVKDVYSELEEVKKTGKAKQPMGFVALREQPTQ
jgi:pyruvate ferredoxin oxidoreductase alpha subunit